MRQWQIPSFGIDSLELIEKNLPGPGPGMVLVRVRAVSLNYRDLLAVKGTYNPRMALPRVPCSDGAGEVIAVGEGVREWKTGDRVCGIFMQNWQDGPLSAAKSRGALGGDIDGMLASEVVLAASGLVKIPEHLSYEEAATLPCAGLTAWNALFSATQIKPGQTVLIQGTGGVSIFALQFGKLAGATVLGTSSSDEKLEKAKAMGLDRGCNYRSDPNWEKWALTKTDSRGVDLVVEVGGAGTLSRSIKSAGYGATLAQIGVLTGPPDVVDVRPIFSRQIRIQGVYVGSRADFQAMNAAISKSRLRPVIDRVFSFSEAPTALRHMESGSHFGKIVIAVG